MCFKHTTFTPATYIGQRWLQLVLCDIISPEQIAFFPLRFILDNIVLTQETLYWAKTSRQPTIFLKLDFSKAYDKVSWRFLFLTMEKIGIGDTFTKWVKFLCGNAKAVVNLNGSLGEDFDIQRGVKQGCPLAPYLFLIVGEVLTHIIKKVVVEGRMWGITLPRGDNKTYLNMPMTPHSWLRAKKKMSINL